MAGDGWEALPVCQERSGGTPKGPRVVGKPSRKAASGWEALLEGRNRSGGPHGGPGVVGSP